MITIPVSSTERSIKCRERKREREAELNEYTIKKGKVLTPIANEVVEYIQTMQKDVVCEDGEYPQEVIEHMKTFIKKYEPQVLLDVKTYFDAETLCIKENTATETKRLKDMMAAKQPTADFKALLNSYKEFNKFKLDERLRTIESEMIVLRFHKERLEAKDRTDTLYKSKTLLDFVMDIHILQDDELLF